MLVLSRQTGGSIMIGDDIIITVLHITRDNVRIGISAPPSVLILRDNAVDKEPKHIEAL